MLNAFWLVVPNVAWTRTANAWPRSAFETVYAAPVASWIAAQTRAFALHRSHVYVTLVGVGLHVPVETWRVLPSTGGPPIVGWAVATSSGRLGAIGPIRFA